jgi:hypothetical protein
LWQSLYKSAHYDNDQARPLSLAGTPSLKNEKQSNFCQLTTTNGGLQQQVQLLLLVMAIMMLYYNYLILSTIIILCILQAKPYSSIYTW